MSQSAVIALIVLSGGREALQSPAKYLPRLCCLHRVTRK